MDAHIASDDWLSSLLKARQPLLQHWCPTHCLFGQHLLSTLNSAPVAIVESEASAAVLSELFPEVLWMAYATVEHLDVALFAPLQGRAVAIYPSTDPSASTYLFFLDLAEAVRQRYDIHISGHPHLRGLHPRGPRHTAAEGPMHRPPRLPPRITRHGLGGYTPMRMNSYATDAHE